MISQRIKAKHFDFAARMKQACDRSPHVPALNQGRLTWVAQQFNEKFGDCVAPEVIRKWLAGEAIPREPRRSRLAAILGVDAVWLLTGAGDRASVSQVKQRLIFDGAVKNVAIGAVQMEGARIALPRDDDSRAEELAVDFYMIIKGVQYAVHVVQFISGVARVQAQALDAFVLGVVHKAPFSFRFYEIDRESIERFGVWSNGEIRVAFDAKAWREITSFSARL